MAWRQTRRSTIGGSLLWAIVAAAALSACATHTVPPGTAHDSTLISADEIDSAHVSTAYDVIHKLRPQFLMGRGKLSLLLGGPPALPRIYVDDQYYGDASTLHGVFAETLESIRYYSGSEAQYKYGHDNAAGVIALVTKH